MKISKRQLRRIIKEEKAKLMEYGGRPYDPTIPGDFERARDNPTGDAPPGNPEWDSKLEKIADEVGDRAAGGYEPSIDGSPEAYADMILDWYAEDPPPPLDQMEDLAFALSKPGYRDYIKEKVLEYIGMMTEGRKTRLQEIFDDESFDAWAAAARGSVNVEDEYVKLIKELGPRSFVTRLIRAFGDMSGHPQGHESIIRWIRANS